MEQELIRKAAEAMHQEITIIYQERAIPLNWLEGFKPFLLPDLERLSNRALTVFYEHTGKQKSEARSQESE